MTDLRTILGIELPIIQAPMAGVQGSALAIAVSNAGGLGSLPCAMSTPDTIRAFRVRRLLRTNATGTVQTNFRTH